MTERRTAEADPPDGGSDRPETPAQRADRNYQELLQELRVLQTGVQILLGFLLVFAAQPRFTELSDGGRAIYVVTLVCCCTAAGLLMAPVAYHRTLFAQGRKAEIVRVAGRSAQAGQFALLLTVVGAALLVLDLVISTTAAVAITSAIAAGIAILWYVFPFYRRRRPGKLRP